VEPLRVDPKINTKWLGLVGPGVRHGGVDGATWSDHTDIRPTMLVLTGLTDDYAHDGRALVEELRTDALPAAVRRDRAGAFRLLAAAYKQINAPVGVFGMKTLEVSTTSLSGDDATYAKLEALLEVGTLGN
jgi:hypothetical protein